MFSGKTEELMRRLTRATIAGQRVELLRPADDTRHGSDELISHALRKMAARRVPADFDLTAVDVEVLGLDEVQFFPPQVVGMIETLADRGVRVVCCGLDMDYRRRPWAVTSDLLGRADFVDKLQAVCLSCGGPATLSQRLEADGAPAGEGALVEIGAADRYEARCRACHRL